ncbi:UDP-N-acetyl-D-mannosaminuronic acid dehydrogenase [Methylobacillus rhizosphaerae]|uniref:NDP-N-acetyl-D-galactosaminuronic acid dehydrogenase n=1 Tax=Methylobacillus rhizosphaerae TaxID=551994 RepID=A0A238XM72_9PROT|nr:UDP-N-acetyl-D-mannosamine dehydrogenase [Methylobacillus rhizosphaerae]SNR59688.1 UDP-N-acetyl-D-mannosaminuronic acid dehydrogenase [Methylobacillus rhizosphaerae]
MQNKFSVIGLGYIGLPTATILASRKLDVIGVDVSASIVDTINQGNTHIVEPDLDALVHEVVHNGYLRATTTPEPASVFVIAVPTPFKHGHTPDLSYIQSAAEMIAPVLAKGNLIILESTSPVGTTEQLSGWLAQARPDLSFPHQSGETSDIRIAYCPERVLPGKIIHELVNNDRVIGGITPSCSQAAMAFYHHFVQGQCIVTNARTAEMCKLAENSFRDVNIAFANELSMICDSQDINVWELIRLANLHPRVNILQPGCGVGGHCIAVDPWFIVSANPDEANLIRAAREVNDSKPGWVIDKVEQAITALTHQGMTQKDIRIACLGLSFKPDIDDLRESPALHIATALTQRHTGSISIVEPHIDALPEQLQSDSVNISNLESALNQAHIILLLVDHTLFKNIQPSLLNNQLLIDTRGVWEI